MEVFWIPHLSILVLLHQTTSARSTTKVIGVLGGSVTFRSHNPDRNVALWSFGDDPIVTVVFRDSPRLIFFEDKFEARFAISKNGHSLIISQLRMEDARTYYLKINRKTSTFILRVFRELAEPMVTCKAQNCSDGSCSSSLHCSVPGDGFGEISYTWRVGNQPLAEGPVLLVNESLLDKLELLTCRVQNPVSSRSVNVTNPGVLCAG
ncbi:SLAF9 protein, partial [Loxia curvirostra]|nr:SLAF9 protein [Loxia curvirostra]